MRVLDFFEPHITLGTSKQKISKAKFHEVTKRLSLETSYSISDMVIGLYAYDNLLQKYQNGVYDRSITIHFTN